jgi:hypothetical protein
VVPTYRIAEARPARGYIMLVLPEKGLGIIAGIDLDKAADNPGVDGKVAGLYYGAYRAK